jgi:uncharacterized membrane protein
VWYWLVAVAFFALYTAVSVRRHLLYGTAGYDLGIFDQIVRSYSNGGSPTTELEGHNFPALGSHFSPILAELAPLYRLFPSAITLLVAQAALFAVSVVPIAKTAQRILGPRAAMVVSIAYASSWGIAQAVEFDFHEIAFAVPLLAFSLCALQARRPVAAVLWALPLMLVKEDQGATVMVLGLLVWRLCDRFRLGALTTLAGMAGCAYAFKVIKASNPDGTYIHLGQVTAGGHHLIYRLTLGLITPEAKATLVVTLFATVAFVALRSPLVLLVAPTLAWRLGSDYSGFYEGHYHYNATAMPILFVAMIDALARVSPGENRALRRHVVITAGVVAAVLTPSNILFSAFQTSTWHTPQRVIDANAVIARLPVGANVAADNILAPHLTDRDTVSLFGLTNDSHPGLTVIPSHPDWIAADRGRVDWPFGSWDQHEAALAAARSDGFRDYFQQGEFLLLHRG